LPYCGTYHVWNIRCFQATIECPKTLVRSVSSSRSKKGGVIGVGVLVYILPLDWKNAKVLLSGSWTIANHPIFGISSFPRTTFAPRSVALARDWSMLTTLK